MPRVSPLTLLPPLMFAGLAAVFWWGLGRPDAGQVPSAFIDRPAPAVPAQALPTRPSLTDADLRRGDITVVNFWASWCPPCRLEHPTLQALARQGVRVAGINFKDQKAQAGSYLDRFGDPFFASGFDPSGRAALDWGVTAPPETFIVSGDGTVLYRFAGPLIDADYQQRFLPQLRKAQGQ